MKNNISKVWLITSVILFFISCSRHLPDNVVARVGKKEITVSEFTNIVQFNTYPRVIENKQYLKQRVFAALIAQKIIAQEVPKYLTDSQKLNNQIQQYKNEAIIEKFWDDQIFSKIEINEDELKKAYFRSKEKRIVEYIQFKSYRDAQKFRILIDQGNSFDSIAGQLGFTQNTLPVDTVEFGSDMPNIEEQVYQLQNNQVSEPVKQGRYYFIFKLKRIQRDIFTAEDDFDFNKKKLEKRLRKKKTLQAYEQYKKEKLPPFAYNLDKELFKALTFKLDALLFAADVPGKLNSNDELINRFDTFSLSRSFKDRSIVTYTEGNTWSIEQLLLKLSVAPYPLEFNSSSAFKTSMIVAVKHILDDEIILNQGKKLGLENTEFVEQQAQMWQDHLRSATSLRKLGFQDINGFNKKMIEAFLLKTVPKYSVKINKEVLDKLEMETTNMVVLKQHFPGRTLVPSIEPFMDLAQWQMFLNKQADH